MDAAKLAALAGKVGSADPALAVVPDRCLHIDGDYAAYYFAGNDDTPLLDAHRNFDSFVARKMRLSGSEKYKLHLTADWSHKGKRFKIATVKPYQGQRDSGRKPKNWAGMRTYLERDEKMVLWEDREADDGCARAGHLGGPRNVALLTRDKDFRMIPGLHVGWKEDTLVHLERGESKVENDLPYGPYWFWLQMLMGDTADNIPGCPTVPLGKGNKPVQCGEARAYTWLGEKADTQSDFQRVVEAYKLAYPATWADRFVEQAGLLWMRTDATASIRNYTQAFGVEELEEGDMDALVVAGTELEARCV
jgi:DNA polymerase-1